MDDSRTKINKLKKLYDDRVNNPIVVALSYEKSENSKYGSKPRKLDTKSSPNSSSFAMIASLAAMSTFR